MPLLGAIEAIEAGMESNQNRDVLLLVPDHRSYSCNGTRPTSFGKPKQTRGRESKVDKRPGEEACKRNVRNYPLRGKQGRQLNATGAED